MARPFRRSRKAKRVVRRGRKAADLAHINEKAGLPKERRSPLESGFFVFASEGMCEAVAK